MQRYAWTRIVELSYNGKEFIMVVRPIVFNEYTESPVGGSRPSLSSSKADSSASRKASGAGSRPTERGASKQRSRSAKPFSNAHRNTTLTFKCLNTEMAKRLYNIVVDHHTFFRWALMLK